MLCYTIKILTGTISLLSFFAMRIRDKKSITIYADAWRRNGDFYAKKKETVFAHYCGHLCGVYAGHGACIGLNGFAGTVLTA